MNKTKKLLAMLGLASTMLLTGCVEPPRQSTSPVVFEEKPDATNPTKISNSDDLILMNKGDAVEMTNWYNMYFEDGLVYSRTNSYKDSDLIVSLKVKDMDGVIQNTEGYTNALLIGGTIVLAEQDTINKIKDKLMDAYKTDAYVMVKVTRVYAGVHDCENTATGSEIWDYMRVANNLQTSHPVILATDLELVKQG